MVFNIMIEIMLMSFDLLDTSCLSSLSNFTYSYFIDFIVIDSYFIGFNDLERYFIDFIDLELYFLDFIDLETYFYRFYLSRKLIF